MRLLLLGVLGLLDLIFVASILGSLIKEWKYVHPHFRVVLLMVSGFGILLLLVIIFGGAG